MRMLESQGRQILPGLWKLDRNTFITRVQIRHPRTGKVVNRKRLLRNASRAEAIALQEKLRTELHEHLNSETASPASVLVSEEIENPTLSTSPPTLGDFAESWLKLKIARGDLEESTEQRYATDLDHLSKRLLSSPLTAATPTKDDIEKWMIASRKTFQPRTINGWRATLQLVLDDAEDRGLIARNPARRVAPLKVDVDLAARAAPKPETLRLVLGELRRGDRVVYMGLLTHAVMGNRWGETSALNRDDFEAETGLIGVHRKVVRGKLKPTTKTNCGREVAVPQSVRLELIDYIAWLDETEQPGRESGLLFPSSVGTPIWSSRVSDALRAACKRTGITEPITSHTFRRGVTDMLRRSKIDPVVAKAIVGHATDRMREHYSTVAHEELHDAANRIGEMLLGTKNEPEAAE